jgi:hypothetical protein
LAELPVQAARYGQQLHVGAATLDAPEPQISPTAEHPERAQKVSTDHLRQNVSGHATVVAPDRRV